MSFLFPPKPFFFKNTIFDKFIYIINYNIRRSSGFFHKSRKIYTGISENCFKNFYFCFGVRQYFLYHLSSPSMYDTSFFAMSSTFLASSLVSSSHLSTSYWLIFLISNAISMLSVSENFSDMETSSLKSFLSIKLLYFSEIIKHEWSFEKTPFFFDRRALAA